MKLLEGNETVFMFGGVSSVLMKGEVRHSLGPLAGTAPLSKVQYLLSSLYRVTFEERQQLFSIICGQKNLLGQWLQASSGSKNIQAMKFGWQIAA